jgi:hypothetical protein
MDNILKIVLGVVLIVVRDAMLGIAKISVRR